jgi:hypothetical protein
VLLNAKITKLTFITQNNHVYEYTAEGLTPEVLLNIRSLYRRQKRDLSIIRLLFRRSYTGIEIFTINIITFLPTTSITFYLFIFLRSTTSYFPTFLRSTISYLPTFLRSTISYLLTFLRSIISYLLTFLRSHRLFPTFLSFCDHTDYQITHTHSANQNRAGFTIPKHGK